ncbi:DinB family protein [Rhodococcus sp. NPDC127528]|uniref:DinB family protein n=1 Tax=unclassified Rhodococcus (in: high G+C Gram-positive bacteria) TaxID=192944 RepID=UPI0036429475
MAITPDTKNWTWVLECPCPDCGFDPASAPFDRVPELLRANVARWPAVLARPDVAVRPNEQTWSPLEYAAHVRDVFRVFRGRLDLMLAQDAPSFPNWDQDATAVAEHYAEQDPRTVATELTEAGLAAADAFEAVPVRDRERRGLRSDGSAFTVATLATYFLHDPVHHLNDVRG